MDICREKRRFEKTINVRHSIAACHGIERRRALAAAHGDRFQVEHFLADDLLGPSALLPGRDVLDLVVHGQIVC